MRVKITQLAALADCIESVSLSHVNHYRHLLRSREAVEPIKVCDINPQGFYVISDGNHRTLAHALEGYSHILVEIDLTTEVMDLSWRWPRVAPLSHTLELISTCSK